MGPKQTRAHVRGGGGKSCWLASSALATVTSSAGAGTHLTLNATRAHRLQSCRHVRPPKKGAARVGLFHRPPFRAQKLGFLESRLLPLFHPQSDPAATRIWAGESELHEGQSQIRLLWENSVGGFPAKRQPAPAPPGANVQLRRDQEDKVHNRRSGGRIRARGLFWLSWPTDAAWRGPVPGSLLGTPLPPPTRPVPTVSSPAEAQ